MTPQDHDDSISDGLLFGNGSMTPQDHDPRGGRHRRKGSVTPQDHDIGRGRNGSMTPQDHAYHSVSNGSVTSVKIMTRRCGQETSYKSGSFPHLQTSWVSSVHHPDAVVLKIEVLVQNVEGYFGVEGLAGENVQHDGAAEFPRVGCDVGSGNLAEVGCPAFVVVGR